MLTAGGCPKPPGEARLCHRDARTGAGARPLLQLSARTVSNHLAHVYAKFGVAGRAELAALLATATADRPA